VAHLVSGDLLVLGGQLDNVLVGSLERPRLERFALVLRALHRVHILLHRCLWSNPRSARGAARMHANGNTRPHQEHHANA
jgi:hypothetical protein